MKSAWRKIECADYGELCARVLAFQDLAHQMELEHWIEPAYMNLNTLMHSRIVRVSANTQQELSPLKELLDSSVEQIYEYLKQAVERSNETRKVQRGKA